MTSPWPEPDYDTRTAMCCLCFEDVSFDNLSRTPEGDLTDICQDCRAMEIQMILKREREGN